VLVYFVVVIYLHVCVCMCVLLYIVFSYGLLLYIHITSYSSSSFEKKVMGQVEHKPICWFRYVDDTFVIWPHDQEKLTEFLNHLNGLHNNDD
jgi:hypothetical protein